MRTNISIFAAFLLVAVVSVGWGLAQDFGITVYTDKTVYVQGQDNLLMSVSGFNNAADMTIDVHIAVLQPGGGIYEIPDWNGAFRPLLSNVLLPTGFNFPKSQLGSYALTAFPFAATGSYLFAAAFTQHGTLNFVGDISFAPFEVQQDGTGETVGRLDFGFSEAYSSFDGARDTTVFASGMFYESSETRGPAALNVEEGCKVTVYDANGSQPGKYLDAGNKIDMQGSPLGNVELQKFEWMGMIMYTPMAELDLGHYAEGNTYAFTGYGGPDVGAFNVSVVAPEKLELYEPSLEPVPVIDRSQDLDVRWNGTGDDQVLVGIGITSVQIDPVTFMPISYTSLCCVFDDDGEATIDASYMSQLDATPGVGLYMPSFSISRVNYTTFSAEGLPAGGAAYATVDMTGDVDLQ